MSETAAAEPLVSVIIPVYNAAKYLRETLDCVCNQTLRNVEIICVDDGSTDDSLGILQEYAARDGRFRILQQKNQYAGVARNNGMAAARGKYMVFWDSDDIFLPEMLEKLYNRAEETGADLVCCDGMGYDDATKRLFPLPWILQKLEKEGVDPHLFCPLRDIPDEVFSYCGSVPWNKLYRRSFLDSNHITWLETQSSNDLTFACHSMVLAQRVSMLHEVLIHYRVREDSIWHSMAKSPRDLYEAHAELLRRMISLNMPESTINQVYRHLLNQLDGHLSHIFTNDVRERAALFEREYEPIFRLSTRELPFAKSSAAYTHLLAYMNPSMTVHIPMRGHVKHLEPCLESLFSYTAEIVLDLTHANEMAIKQAEEMARSYFWIHATKAPAKPRAPMVAHLSPGLYLPRHVKLDELAKAADKTAEIDLDPLCNPYVVIPKFYVSTPHKRSWRFFGLPLLTNAYGEDSCTWYVLGRKTCRRAYRPACIPSSHPESADEVGPSAQFPHDAEKTKH